MADSSSVYKKMFTQAITEVNKNIVVASVSDSDEALALITRRNYDIVIADAEIPGSGLFALLTSARREMPRAYVLVTARPSQINEKLFTEARDKGASECMTKPIYDSYGENVNIIKRTVTEVVAYLSGGGAVTESAGGEPPKLKKTVKRHRFSPEIIVIAASTGGPMALETIIPQIRGDFPVPILIVQHMPPQFTDTLAQNLNVKAALNVKVAENGETAVAGTVYLAPGGIHMKLDAKNRIYLEDSPPINGVRPAADILFASVADSFAGERVLAVILTGMGSDGKAGLIKLKEKKDCYCVAQSERTCVVYGMPRAAAENGLADIILDMEKISGELENFGYEAVKR